MSLENHHYCTKPKEASLVTERISGLAKDIPKKLKNPKPLQQNLEFLVHEFKSRFTNKPLNSDCL
jgi:hypothetical protein